MLTNSPRSLQDARFRGNWHRLAHLLESKFFIQKVLALGTHWQSVEVRDSSQGRRRHLTPSRHQSRTFCPPSSSGSRVSVIRRMFSLSFSLSLSLYLSLSLSLSLSPPGKFAHGQVVCLRGMRCCQLKLRAVGVRNCHRSSSQMCQASQFSLVFRDREHFTPSKLLSIILTLFAYFLFTCMLQYIDRATLHQAAFHGLAQ